MTTISTYLTASLLAVTFGWVPAEPAKDDASATRGYDYLVQLSPEDLEALRDGRATDLVSALPTDIGPIERLRVYVGTGDAPQQLLPRDENSPKRIAAAATAAQTRTVAKPVVPDWPDAARLLEDASSSDEPVAPTSAEKRTTYQNPDVLRGLSEGFKEGTSAVAEGTQKIFEKSGEELQRASQDLLNGAARVLEGQSPLGGQPPLATNPSPYGARPGYVPGAYNADPNAAPVNGGVQPAQYGQGQYPQNANPLYPNQAQPNQGQPAFSPDDVAINGDTDPRYNPSAPQPRTTSVAEDFVTPQQPGFNATRPLAPVQRGPQTAATTRTSDFDAFKPADTFGASAGTLAPPAFPDLAPPQNPGLSQNNGSAWSNTANTNSGANYPSGGGFANTTEFDPPATTQATNTGASANTGWNGAGGGGTNYQNQTNNDDRRDIDSRYFEKLLLVVLGAATCFTWIAYIDVRNKYRSILRNTPGGAYGAAA